MSGTKDRLWNRFKGYEYRHSYIESFLNSLISAQIRSIRERENLSQQELAEKIGTTQPAVSRIENPDYSRWSINTLRKLARAFDMALSIKFISFGDSLNDIEGFGEDRLLRPSFHQDSVFQEEPEVQVLDFPGTKRLPTTADNPSDSSRIEAQNA